MTVELVTGHAGSAHVSAADVGWYNVGTVGAGKYVLDTGTQLECNVQSANAATIGIGDALFEGRHVRVSATETVALDNGAQGVNRNDLICIKYDYNSGTAVESVSIVVIKGTASSGTPSDPDVPSGSILEGASTAYMPLWRIPISGITVGTPVKLFGEVLSSLDGALSRTWDVTQIPNLPASKITNGTLGVDRIPTLTANKVPSLDASKITSGTLGTDRIPNLNTSKLTAGTLGAARGGTGKTYGFAWQQLGTSNGSTAISFNLTGYSEVMIVGRYSTSYLGSVVLPVAQLSTTAREVYLGGGYAGVGYNGRYAALTVTSTKATPLAMSINDSDKLSSATWWVYAR